MDTQAGEPIPPEQSIQPAQPQSKTAFMVLNPVSGLTIPGLVRQRYEAIFREAGWEPRIYTTSGTEVLAEVVRQALDAGASLVIAAGGDGTVSEVGSALAFTGVPLGIVPTGTWNALAHNLAIPLALDSALRLLIGAHREIEMDAFKIGERYYLLNVGVGVSSSLIATTQRVQKRRFGFFAYLWNFVKQLAGIRLQTITLGVDGIPYRLRVSELMMVNSSLIGLGELPTALEIDPCDGRVEIIGICAPTAWEFIKIGLRFLVGRRTRTPGFISFTAKRSVEIHARKSLVVEADGEIIGSTPVEVNLVRRAVRVIVP